MFHDYLQRTSRFWVDDEATRFAYLTDEETQALRRGKQQLKDRGAVIVKTMIDGQIIKQQRMENERFIDYMFHTRQLIKQKEDFHVEEKTEIRRANIRNESLVSDIPLTSEGSGGNVPFSERSLDSAHRSPFHYERLQAVRYADRWWNSYNPDYQTFDVDCTNYVSQCLHAAGAPMTGSPNRAKGWWYSGNNWSYSWAVAHALRWYLAGAAGGLRAKEVSSPRELMPGDVICYDFDGDGNWEHNTIVTAKDGDDMPLVNAHTTNSRHRYWAYEDSMAWTPNIAYKFFHIIDDE